MAQIEPADLYNYLLSQGATQNEATMLTSAAGAESGWDPTKTHDKDPNTGLPTGYGMWGHRNDRLAAMQDTFGVAHPNWQQQAQFALGEVKGNPLVSASTNFARTPQELTVAQMHFERPQGYSMRNPQNGDNFDGRLRYTNQIANGNLNLLGPRKPGSSSMDPTLDPNNPNNGVDPAAHAQYQQIFQMSQSQSPQSPTGPYASTPGAAQPNTAASAGLGQTPMGALASGLQSGMHGGGSGGQTPLLSQLLFGKGGLGGAIGLPPGGISGAISGALKGAVPPNGLIGSMFQPNTAAASAAATPAAVAPSIDASAAAPAAAASVSPAVDASAAGSSLAGVAGSAAPVGGGLGGLASLFGGGGVGGALGGGMGALGDGLGAAASGIGDGIGGLIGLL